MKGVHCLFVFRRLSSISSSTSGGMFLLWSFTSSNCFLRNSAENTCNLADSVSASRTPRIRERKCESVGRESFEALETSVKTFYVLHETYIIIVYLGATLNREDQCFWTPLPLGRRRRCPLFVYIDLVLNTSTSSSEQSTIEDEFAWKRPFGRIIEGKLCDSAVCPGKRPGKNVTTDN